MMVAPLVFVTFASLLEALIAYQSKTLPTSRFVPQVFRATTFAGNLFVVGLINYTLYFVHRVFLYPFLFSPLRHLPSPPKGSYPILGHGPMMLRWPPGSPHLQMIKDTPNDGLIHVRAFFYAGRLIVTKPAAIAEVLTSKSYDFAKPTWVRLFLRQYLGDGLLMSEGDEHRHQRKQIMPAFSFRHIKDLYPIFWSKSSELCEVIRAELKESTEMVLEMNHFSTQVTMDIIGLAGLGRDICSLRNADDELIKLYEEILEPTLEKGAFFVAHLFFPKWFIEWLPWRLNERVKVTTSNLRRICFEFVRDKRLKMKLEDNSDLDILSIMIRSNNFSDEGIVDQLLTFMAAGHETTSSALTWATYLLSIHPQIQTRLRDEIHSAIKSPREPFQTGIDIAGVLESLPLLNAVCNETLRLYPTIPVSSRSALQDTSICGHFVPRGTDVLICPWATNRDPSLWGEDVEDFKPERWLDPSTGKVNYVGGADSNYAFLTFFHGPRSCIGQNFARGEMRALVASFVGSFEMKMANPGEKILAGGAVTIKPRNGLKLKLKPIPW